MRILIVSYRQCNEINNSVFGFASVTCYKHILIEDLIQFCLTVAVVNIKCIKIVPPLDTQKQYGAE